MCEKKRLYVANSLMVTTVDPVMAGKEGNIPFTYYCLSNESTKELSIGNRTIPLTKEFGHFLGMYLGNGWCDSNSCKIHIASINNTIKEKFIYYVNKFLRESDIKGMNYPITEHYFGGNAVHSKASITIPDISRKFMIESFNHGALNKMIPEKLLNGPKDFLWGLLSGLIDTDGSISCRDIEKKGKLQQNKNVMYATSSPELAIGVQELCFSLGIYASITIINRKINDEFTVVMSSVDVHKDRENLCLISEKMNTLNSFRFGSQPNPNDIVPITKRFYELLKKRYGTSIHRQANVASVRGYATRDFLPIIASEELLDELDKEISFREKRFDSIIFTKDIKESEEISCLLKTYIIKEAKAHEKNAK